MSESQSILNPNVYLNYLQPADAIEYEVARDVFLVTFGALAWDILSSLPSDWTIIRTTKPSPVLFAYFASRLCALVVVFMSALGKTGPVEDCGAMELILWIFLVFASGSSSYLFLKRVHAVFHQERFIRHAFTALWVAGVGASTAVLVGPLDDYYQIANTKHCMNVEIKSYVSAAFIVPLVFDSLVYFGISFKILVFHPRATSRPRSWRSFCCGEALPRLSRAVLQGGQEYYSITNGVNITRLVLVLSSSTSPVLQLAPSIPAIALTSAMACRVFRNLKLEALRNTEAGVLTTIHFANKEHDNIQSTKNTEAAFGEVGLEQC